MNIKHYFTSEIEIKPQPLGSNNPDYNDYFTSEIEIKPQLSTYVL